MERRTGATAAQLRPIVRPWLASLRQRSEATARTYQVAVDRFLDSLGDGELDPDAIADFMESLDGLAVGSQAAYISATRAFLRVCQSQGLVDKSPAEFLVRPRVAITSYGRYLDVDELRRLLAAARRLGPTQHATVLLLWSTGLRVSEAANAEWRDVFRDPVGRIGLRVVGKGGKERIVKLLPETINALAEVRRGAHAGSDELDASDRTPLIPERHGRKSSAWQLWRHVKDSVARAGITKPASPHWLRHSALTWMAAGGASAFMIQWQAGHSKLETSARYVHMARGLEDSAADHLPALA